MREKAWLPVSSMAGRRSGHGCCSVGGRLIVVGGYNERSAVQTLTEVSTPQSLHFNTTQAGIGQSFEF